MLSSLLLYVLDLSGPFPLLVLVSGAGCPDGINRNTFLIELKMTIEDLSANVLLDFLLSLEPRDDLKEVKFEFFLLGPGWAMNKNAVESFRSHPGTLDFALMREHCLLASIHDISGFPCERIG